MVEHEKKPKGQAHGLKATEMQDGTRKTTGAENEKVYIFNGWTFASDPSLTPFDHAIYDLQLLNCYNV